MSKALRLKGTGFGGREDKGEVMVSGAVSYLGELVIEITTDGWDKRQEIAYLSPAKVRKLRKALKRYLETAKATEQA